MSKSYNNSILLSELDGDVHVKMQSMSNGGQRPTQQDPGDPDICPVGDMHRLFSSPMVLDHITNGCRTAAIRCDECKFMAANSINQHLHPIRKRREELEKNPELVWSVLEQGALRAAARAEQTMQSLRAATGLSRDRSGVRVDRSALTLEQKKNLRDLSMVSDWWHLTPALLVRNLREIWRKDIVPIETALKRDTDGVWLTRNNRRVFVTAAIQSDGNESWSFSVKPKSYEILVLLCWDKDFLIRDFVVPQKLYVVPWTAAKRASGVNNIIFSVARIDGRYMLQLPNSVPIDITETEASYGIIGN
jgi:tryptophanyl-tRNA synthetase